MQDRLNRLRTRMNQQGVDLLAIGPGAHMQWLLGFHPHGDERPCLFCVSASGAGFLMPALNAKGSRVHTDLPFFEWADADGPDAAFGALLDDLGVASAKRVVLDETMRADFAALVQDTMPEAERHFTQTTVGALRQCKDADEFERLKSSASSADTAMQTAWSEMRAGMKERDVAQIVRASFSAQGARPVFNIVASGGNGAFPHHQTGDRTLQRGDAVVMDIGGSLSGYASDITRMAVIGDPPEGYDEIHQIVEDAVSTALKAARPGALAKDVDLAARQVISDAGYGDYFVHRTGHGLGVETHEPPYLTSVSDTVLEEGMVFSIEPGIYLPDRFGIRLEEIVYLRADGPEIFSSLPRDLTVIGR